jgi:hypothetical protein
MAAAARPPDGPVDWPFEPFPYSALDASILRSFDYRGAVFG